MALISPICRDAGVPDAVPVSFGVAERSPVSLRAQPAKLIRVAAKIANFFIDLPFQFLGCLVSELRARTGSPFTPQT